MSRHFALAAFLALVALIISSCSQSKDDEPVYAEVPNIEHARAVDLLFVIDNSNSMQEEQDQLVADAEPMLRELIDPSSSDGVTPPAVDDLHVGVATNWLGNDGYAIMPCASMNGDNGLLQNAGRLEGCEQYYSAPECYSHGCPWLTHSTEFPDDGTDSEDPPIWDDFRCIGNLGTGACGFEQPLEATHRASTSQAEPGRPNEGFFRYDSVFSVVIVTDEDDCSVSNLEMFNPSRDEFGPMNTRCAFNPDELHPIDRYTDALRDLRPFDDNLLVVAAITGVPIDGSWGVGDPIDDLEALQRVNPENPNELIPSCMTSMGLAFPPPRLAEFIYSFEEAGILGSICRDDWSDTMMAIARAIQERMVYECYVMPDGVDPATECRLIEILSDGTEREIPHEAEGVEGWSIGSTARGCPSGQLQFSDGVEVVGEVRLECEVAE